MGESTHLDRLLRLMPPHDGAGEQVDWGSVERKWRTRFPGDYRNFMAAYGDGGIDGYLGVHSPAPSRDVGPDDGMEADTALARSSWAQRPPAGFEGSHSSLISWGVDSSSDILTWIASAADPDLWPVAVWKRGDASWHVYQCGMVEFLCKVFDAEFDENPLSDMGLWGNASPRFLSTEEERRYWESGIDPWFDEDGQYREMFKDMFGPNS